MTTSAGSQFQYSGPRELDRASALIRTRPIVSPSGYFLRSRIVTGIARPGKGPESTLPFWAALLSGRLLRFVRLHSTVKLLEFFEGEYFGQCHCLLAELRFLDPGSSLGALFVAVGDVRLEEHREKRVGVFRNLTADLPLIEDRLFNAIDGPPDRFVLEVLGGLLLHISERFRVDPALLQPRIVLRARDSCN